jgi:rubrerythrin
MSDNDFAKIIEELVAAHNTEVTGYFYYKAAADIVEDEKGKNIFTHLAKEELDHIRVVSAIADSIKDDMGWISYEDAVRKGASSGGEGLPIFSGKNELIERLEKDQTGLNAVKIGIEIEDEAVDFYSGLLKKAGSPEEKVVLTELLEMEKAHLKILRWESEALVSTGFWCGNMEYSVEKEID